MLTLQEIKVAVDQLSPEDRAELLAYVEQLNEQINYLNGISPEERIRRLDAAAKTIRDGFTDEEWAEAQEAMNSEYIELIDEDIWKD